MKILILNCRGAEASPSPSLGVDADGPAAPSVFNATDRTSGPVICSYMTGWGSQGQGVRGDNRGQINRFGFRSFSSVVHRCRSLLLSFSTWYLGILGLEGAKNCILARTSHLRTTSEKRTKALLRKCPLFGGSTVVETQGKVPNRQASEYLQQNNWVHGNLGPQVHWIWCPLLVLVTDNKLQSRHS